MSRGGPSLTYPRPVLRVRFLRRPNRFLARVRLEPNGPDRLAHVPNPGRMEELLVDGVTSGYAVPARSRVRRTSLELVSVRSGHALVSIDTRASNELVRRALVAGGLPELGPGPWRPEVRWGTSRLDFGVAGAAPGRWRALLEVKSSNLRVGASALFPDAPTARGRRHLRELTRAARQGVRCAVLFLVQRADVGEFRPNAALDPEFALAMEGARRAGVRLVARTVQVEPDRLRLGRRLPVRGPLQRLL